jgi:hypothetical protein
MSTNKQLTIEQKREALINREMDCIFDDFKGTEEFIYYVLKNGYEGYSKLNSEEIGAFYKDIFEED